MAIAKGKTPGKGALKRAATEERILAAFEQVLLRDGVENLGVNSVVKEAGVGKGLLYEYFGGLDGLASVWMERRHFTPSLEEIIGDTLDSYRERNLQDQLKQVHTNYATYLKNNPIALQLLAEEVLKPTQLSESLQQIRRQIGRSHEQLFTEISPVEDPDYHALIFVLQAAGNYLALRAGTSPSFNGLDLASPAGWKTMMGMLERVVDLVAEGKAREQARARRKNA